MRSARYLAAVMCAALLLSATPQSFRAFTPDDTSQEGGGNSAIHGEQWSVPETSQESASLDPLNISSELQDPGSDGRADLLVVRVAVRVVEAGDFRLRGRLLEDQWGLYVDESDRIEHLEPGAQSFPLIYSGLRLSRSPVDGPWYVWLELTRFDSFEPSVLSSWTTPAYLRAQFETRAIATVNGTLRDPAGTPMQGYAWAMDPSAKFVEYAESDAGGRFQLHVYDGSFIVQGIDRNDIDRGTVARMDLAQGDDFNVIIGPYDHGSIHTSAALTSWQVCVVTASRTLTGSTAVIRVLADRFGDFDGFANDSELSRSTQAAMAYLPYTAIFDFPIRVDGVELERGAWSYRGATGEGDVTSSDPVTTTVELTYRNDTVVSGKSAYTANFTLAYDTVYDDGILDQTAHIRLPPGYAGILTVQGNATVRQVSPGEWDIDPLRSQGSAAELTVEISASPEPSLPIPLVLGAVLGCAGGAAIAAYLFLRRRRKMPPG